LQFGLRHPEEGTTEGSQFAVAISFQVFFEPRRYLGSRQRSVFSWQFGLRHPEEGTTEGSQFAVAISFEVFFNLEGICEEGNDQ